MNGRLIGLGFTPALILLLFASPAWPQSAATPAQQLARAERQKDLESPIEIDADRLEVRQKEHVAVFDGNVTVRQGRLRLKADRLEVRYRPKAGDQAGAALEGNISRLDAVGHVFLSSPLETAEGERGVYDVYKRTVTLEGDVVLTRGQNVLRGRKLVVDLASGVSKLESPDRVKGIFSPSKQTNQ